MGQIRCPPNAPGERILVKALALVHQLREVLKLEQSPVQPSSSLSHLLHFPRPTPAQPLHVATCPQLSLPEAMSHLRIW